MKRIEHLRMDRWALGMRTDTAETPVVLYLSRQDENNEEHHYQLSLSKHEALRMLEQLAGYIQISWEDR